MRLFCRLLSAPLLAGFCVLVRPAAATPAENPSHSWTADNGNGTYTNPLFYDEFSDPDMIRVGEDFYLAGTTMHAMPGLVLLHSRDLVNWKFLSYAAEQLDFGPEYRLEGGRNIYGQGVWAPCLRFHNGTFYLFTNVNGRKTQGFRAKDPAGPWTRSEMGSSLHDLSVLFDDDGKVYVVWNYNEVMFAELKPDLSDIIPETKRVLIPNGAAMGEGHHFYKIHGKYYIISADYAPVGRMQAARADRPEGPYETVVISANETMGTERGWSVRDVGLGKAIPKPGASYEISKPPANELGAVPLHQGGIIDLPNGDWWGYSMMDFRSVGRTTFLSPVTWQDGWPYFGLAGNLGRSPRTWIKPAVDRVEFPTAPYQRSDDFSGEKLLPIWQWNHVPDGTKWSLIERPGALRLHTLPAEHFLVARNSLTQRAIGPESIATITLDGSGLQKYDVAGLGLLNIPCAWLGLVRTPEGYVVRFYDAATNQTTDAPIPSNQVMLRVAGDYDHDSARFSFSVDGKTFTPVGGEVRLPYQLKTFQGVRYALFAYNTAGHEGGYADFDAFVLREPLADRSANIPFGKVVSFRNVANDTLLWASPRGIIHWKKNDAAQAREEELHFRIHDRGKGRVALESISARRFVTVAGQGLSADIRLTKEESEASLFQWQDLLRGECMLLSLKTHRYLGLAPDTGEPYSATSPGPKPDRKDGAVFVWEEVTVARETARSPR